MEETHVDPTAAEPQAVTTQPVKNADGTNLDGTVTVTFNAAVAGGEMCRYVPKGEPVNVSRAYADAMQDSWHVASRSDVPDFEDPSSLPEAKATAVAKANWEAKQKRNGK